MIIKAHLGQYNNFKKKRKTRPGTLRDKNPKNPKIFFKTFSNVFKIGVKTLKKIRNLTGVACFLSR